MERQESSRGDELIPGYSEACFSGHHESCTERDCRCLCAQHPWNQALMKKAQSASGRSSAEPASTLVCGYCDRIPRSGDTFCRSDGTRLMPGKMCGCGKMGEPDDLYCGGCGQKFGPAAVPVPELSDEEIAAMEAKARQRP